MDDRNAGSELAPAGSRRSVTGSLTGRPFKSTLGRDGWVLIDFTYFIE